MGLEKKFGEIFDEIDTDGNGFMSLRELRQYVGHHNEAARVQMGIGRWEDFLREVDGNKDGKVSRDEFLAYFTHVNLDRQQCYEALFEAIDANGDGSLSWEEVRNYRWHENAKLFQMLGISSWHAMISDMTRGSATEIDKQSFVNYLMHRPTTGTLPNSMDMNIEPAWRAARRMPARLLDAAATSSNRAPTSGSRRKKSAAASGGEDVCWDFQAGYCSRGSRCHYKHSMAGAVEEAELDAHRAYCKRVAAEVGLNLSGEALIEMQTMDEQAAGALIRSLGHGGDHEHVHDKNYYAIHFARRSRASAHHFQPTRH